VKGLIHALDRSECMCLHVQAAEIARNPELKASHERLLAAWQSALPLIFPKLKVACPQLHISLLLNDLCLHQGSDNIHVSALLAYLQNPLCCSFCGRRPVQTSKKLCMVVQESKVLEVMQAGDRRIVVLTQTHVALLRVRVAAVRSVYRAMWKVRLSKIQTVRGVLSALSSIILQQACCAGTASVHRLARLVLTGPSLQYFAAVLVHTLDRRISDEPCRLEVV
jgi:hypothetical protein